MLNVMHSEQSIQCIKKEQNYRTEIDTMKYIKSQRIKHSLWFYFSLWVFLCCWAFPQIAALPHSK